VLGRGSHLPNQGDAELTVEWYWRKAPICGWTGKTGTTPNSPVLLDVFGLGSPDLLSKGGWHKDRGGKPEASALRDFDMDMNGVSKWEWVGPKSALLVYGLEKPEKVDGSNLFGNSTFGEVWTNGYEPLKRLDKNADKKLTAQELAVLWLWLDKNSDAKVDEGEIVPAKEMLKELDLSYQVDEVGNAWQDAGATLIDGVQIKSWDWWSLPGK